MGGSSAASMSEIRFLNWSKLLRKMGSNTYNRVVEIHNPIREDSMNVNRIIRKSLPVKDFRFGEVTLVFVKLIYVSVHPRR